MFWVVDEICSCADLDYSDLEIAVAASPPKVARLSAHPEPHLPEPDMHEDTSDDIDIDLDLSESDKDDGLLPHVNSSF